MKNQSGISLIETLVMMVIMGIISYAMMTLSNSQQLSIKNIEQKHEALTLRSTISQLWSSPDVCNWQLSNLHVDVSGVTGTESNNRITALTSTRIYSGYDTGSAVIAEVGQRINGSPNGPEVKHLRLGNFLRISNDVYFVSLMIGLEERSVAMPMRDIVVPNIIIRTRTTDPTSNKTILGCGTPSPKEDLYDGWPNLLTCGNTVWHIRSPGQYNCFRGGEVTTRSAIVQFDPVTRMATSTVNRTDTANRCVFDASCASRTIDQMRNDGAAR